MKKTIIIIFLIVFVLLLGKLGAEPKCGKINLPNNSSLTIPCTLASDLSFGDALKAQIAGLDNRWDILNIDTLAYCIARAETGNCTLGVGLTHNNCFGIRYNGRFARYASPNASYDDFKRIWTAYYKTLPNVKMAVKWTGNDKPDIWLRNVKSCYTGLRLPEMG